MTNINESSDVGPVQVLDTSEKMIARLDSITVMGGGDCPERSMQGILNAMKVAEHGSFITVYTDATAKDSHLKNKVLDLARKKEHRIYYFLSRNCLCPERPKDEKKDCEHPKTPFLYQKTADVSGGMVFHVKKSEINEVMKLFNTMYDIGVYRYNGPIHRQLDLVVPIDPSLSEFSISVVGDDIQLLMLFDADNTLHLNVEKPLDTRHAKLYKIVRTKAVRRKEPNYVGMWRIRIVSTKSKHVRAQVSGQGPGKLKVDFGKHGLVAGRPVAGMRYDVAASVDGLSIDSSHGLVLNVRIIGHGRRVAAAIKMTHRSSLGHKFTSTSKLLIPSKPFFIQVEGKDSAGNHFSRFTSQAVDPIIR